MHGSIPHPGYPYWLPLLRALQERRLSRRVIRQSGRRRKRRGIYDNRSDIKDVSARVSDPQLIVAGHLPARHDDCVRAVGDCGGLENVAIIEEHIDVISGIGIADSAVAVKNGPIDRERGSGSSSATAPTASTAGQAGGKQNGKQPDKRFFLHVILS